MAEFKTQSGNLKSYNYTENDNLFSGTWNLNNHNLEKYDPFITGYSFIVWTKLPSFFDDNMYAKFKGMTEKNFKSFSGVGDINLSVEDVTHGFTGNAYGVAANIQKENTSFTLTHVELGGSPVRELYTYWVSGIRDFETGIATYHGKIGSKECPHYSAKYHTGELLYVQTDPAGGFNGTGIEFACYYTNVMPTKIPMEHLNYTSGEHSVVEISQDFRGNFHMSEDINNLAVQFMKDNHIELGFGDYQSQYTNANINGQLDPTFIKENNVR